jgi:hypothetical protein
MLLGTKVDVLDLGMALTRLRNAMIDALPFSGKAFVEGGPG